MKAKRYSILLSILVLVFTFLYTFKINFDLTKQLNIINLAITFIVLLLWLLLGYLLLIKDILKITDNERNGIILVLVLSAVIFFYYNPFPSPDGYYINIPRAIYFVITLLVFILLIIVFRKEKLVPLILALFIPFIAQSYLINVLEITKYTSYTLYIIIFFTAVAYSINYFREK